MKRWICIWVLLLSSVWVCEADQLPAGLGEAMEGLYKKHSYSTLAMRTVEARLSVPSDPFSAVTSLANDSNSEVRMIAAELLAGLGSADAAKPLWSLLHDNSEAVRMLAVWALGRLNESVLIQPDVSGLRDPRANVRRLTAETLARLRNPSAEPDLINVLSDSDDLVRWQAVIALSFCGSPRAVPALSLRLKDSSGRIRRTAAGVLGKLGDPTVVSPLIAMLDDVDWQTRAAAANALATLMSRFELDRATMTNTILSKLKPDDFALIVALRDLGLTNDERAFNGLVHALTGTNHELAADALHAIVGLRITPVLPLLAQHSRHSNPDVRQRILEVFGKIGGANEVPVVIAALNDPVASVQLTAVIALRQLRQYLQPNRLVEKLANPDPHVRAAAARFFGEVGDPRFANKVATLLYDENRFVRSAAIEALRTLGDRSAVGPLIEVLTRQIPDGEATGLHNIEGKGVIVGTSRPLPPLLSGLELLAQKAEAIKVLGDWRAIDAVVPIIENGLQSNDAQLLAVSAYALGQIGDRRAIGPLIALVQNFYIAAPFETDSPNQVTINDRVNPNLLRQEYELQCNARSTVIWALGRLGDPIAAPIVRQALLDHSIVVREAANEAIARLDASRPLLATAYIHLPGFQQPNSVLFGYNAFSE